MIQFILEQVAGLVGGMLSRPRRRKVGDPQVVAAIRFTDSARAPWGRGVLLIDENDVRWSGRGASFTGAEILRVCAKRKLTMREMWSVNPAFDLLEIETSHGLADIACFPDVAVRLTRLKP